MLLSIANFVIDATLCQDTKFKKPLQHKLKEGLLVHASKKRNYETDKAL